MLAGNDVLEVRRAQRPEYACWFVGDRCESEGDMIFATKVRAQQFVSTMLPAPLPNGRH